MTRRSATRNKRRARVAKDRVVGRNWLAAGGGVLLAMSVVCGCAAVNSLCWQWQTRWQYTEGVCRVVAARVVRRNQLYELNIEHQVELDGRSFRPTRNTEQDIPAYNNLQEAETALVHFAVGTTHPCWYDAADPDRHSVLVHHDMNSGSQMVVLFISVALGGLGVLFLRGGRAEKVSKKS